MNVASAPIAMKRPLLRSALLLSTLTSAISAQAGTHLLDFDLGTSGASVGNAYRVSDGVSFFHGQYLAYPTAPSKPNALFDEVFDTIVVNSQASLVGGVGLVYASNSFAASQATGSLSVYSGLGGTGTLLGTVALADTNGYATFVSASLSFSGQGRSIVLTGASRYILYDDLSFATAVPGPVAAIPFALGALKRRRRKA